MGLENFLKKGKSYIRKSLITGIASSLLFFSYCDKVPTSSEPKEETHVLSEQTLEQLSYVGENNLRFSSPTNFSSGDIIVAGISENTPQGFLREVTKTSSDKKTIYTKQANLEQALEDAYFEFYKILSPTGAESFMAKEGISKSMAPTGFDFNLNIDNVVLYDFDGNLNTTNDQVTANGTLSFNSYFALDFDIKDYNLEKLLFKNITREKASLEIKKGFSVLSGAGIPDIKIAEYNFSPFVAGYIPTAPPFPVVIAPKLEIFVSLEGTPLSAGVTQEAVLSSEILYEGGYWQSTKDFSNTFDFSFPSPKENLSVKASTFQNLILSLYGLVGPSAGVCSSLKFESGDETWKFYGGLEALLGVNMEIFSHRIVDYTKKVIDYEKLLAEGEFDEEPTTSTMTDPRDNQIYNIVKIGDQWWMAENLNIGTMIGSATYQTDNGIIEKSCPGNLESNFEIYGGLYEWGEMMQYSSSDDKLIGNTRGISPSGWHIPTKKEWETLFNYLGGLDVAGGKMKEAGITHWDTPNTGATNSSGFTALPSSYSGFEPGRSAFFWSATEYEYDSDKVWNLNLRYNEAEVNWENGGNANKVWNFSVRCVKNE